MRHSILAAMLLVTPANAQHEGHGGPHTTDSHQSEAQESSASTKSGTDLEPGSAPAAAPPLDHYADRFWEPAEMARARARMQREHGGMSYSMIMFDLAELQIQGGRESYRIEGEGWFGGDINRFVVKAEAEGELGDNTSSAEVQALYSRAIDAYWNLQAGIRQDVRKGSDRSYGVLSIEGLAPYWFEIEGMLFLSSRGDLLARLEGNYDQRITNRLILQPRAEVNFSAQTVAATGTGSGLSDLELGLRLRYQFVPEFAPYIGVSFERKIGDTAQIARMKGDSRSSKGIVLGLRTWF